ncbi:hypothetical protein [Lacipirellula sp.]|uniref:hypothetical protein n=1 Tax=Lacipirellula sp. TaxID=2691419 RepID=UPI003D0B7D05
MDSHAYELAEIERRLARHGLLRQVSVQAVALFFFWMATNAVVRVALPLYVDLDLELPVNTINFVVWPGPVGIGLATLLAVLVMLAMPWFPYPKLAAVVASLVFLVAVYLLAIVVVSAVLPLEDLQMLVPAA